MLMTRRLWRAPDAGNPPVRFGEGEGKQRSLPFSPRIPCFPRYSTHSRPVPLCGPERPAQFPARPRGRRARHETVMNCAAVAAGACVSECPSLSGTALLAGATCRPGQKRGHVRALLNLRSSAVKNPPAMRSLRNRSKQKQATDFETKIRGVTAVRTPQVASYSCALPGYDAPKEAVRFLPSFYQRSGRKLVSKNNSKHLRLVGTSTWARSLWRKA